MTKNSKANLQKGFSLVEMMVVVGIMSILAMVAIPNLMHFQAKAKQANAKTELATIYGLEKAFMTEFSNYTNNLIVLGYSPDGVPLTTAGCLTAPTPTTWPQRYYTTGFTADGNTDIGIPASITNPCPGVQTIPANLPVGVATLSPPGAVGTVRALANPPTFTIESWGNIGGNRADQWTITEAKILSNTQVGF